MEWTHLKSAMPALEDLLRCSACNKVLVEPVTYRCGHFFCNLCSKKAGTRCGFCKAPTLASEIKPDCLITAVVDCFNALSAVVNSDKKTPTGTGECKTSSKSSRSTVYESSPTRDQIVNKCDLESTEPKVPVRASRDKPGLKIGKVLEGKDHPKKSFQRKSDSKTRNVSVETKKGDKETKEKEFVVPTSVKRSSVKNNQKTIGASKNKTDSNLLDDPDITGISETVSVAKAKLSRKESSTLLSVESKAHTQKNSKDDAELPSDEFVTPKKPKRTSKTVSSVSPDLSKKDLNSTAVKSTPRRNSTPAKDVVKRNHKGETPLHVACIKRNVERVRTLLEANASPNTKDNAGWTPLHEAASHGFTEVAELLLKSGAFVDVPGAGNVTSLHEAVLNNHLPIVKLLVGYGADIYARSSEGKTPLDLAASDEVRDILLKTKNIDQSPVGDAKNVRHHETERQIVLCGESGLTADEKKELSALALRYSAKLVPGFGPDVTHLVVPSDQRGTCPPTVDVLCAILRGTHILTRDWINLGDIDIDDDIFEIAGVVDFGDSEAPKKSRLNAEKQLPGLFDGCHFYVTNNVSYKIPNCTFSRANIITLIKAGGGTVLSRQPDPEAIPLAEQTVPYHAPRDGLLSSTSHFIIYSPGRGEPELKYNMKHCKTLPVEWFINCVLNWQLIDP